MARRYFLYLFSPIFVAVVVASIAVVTLNIYHVRAQIGDREAAKINGVQVNVRETLSTAVTDLAFLVGDEDVVEYALNPTDEHRMRLERSFLAFSRAKPFFDQVRFLSVDGQEHVRVNLGELGPVATDVALLQNKKHRAYFSEAMALPSEHVFMSPLDLNVERNQVETPLKPVIRLVSPVDVNGKRYGVIVLNYLAENLLRHARQAFALDESVGLLTNAEGYWLIGPNHELEWAFMFGRHDRFKDLYPEAWNKVSDTTTQAVTDNGVFTIAKLFPPARVVSKVNSDAYWVLASRVPLTAWYRDPFVEHIPELAMAFLALLVFGFGSWRVAANRAMRERMDGLYNRRLVEALDESEHRNTAVVEASYDVVMTCSQSGVIRHANHAAERVFNTLQEDLIGREVSEFLMDPDTISVREHDGVRKLMARERFETYAVRATGEGFPAEITLTPIQTEGYTRFSLFIRDITMRRSFEERLKRLANYDPLTGLANRVLLLEHLSGALKNNRGPEGPYAVIMGDLDDFRIVNDTLGHVVGDEALKVAAERIHQRTPPNSLAGRFGGDEFVVVVPCRADRGGVIDVCKAILNAFERPLEVGGHRLYVGISLGVAFADTDDDTATGLLQMADTAMYAAKDGGRNTYRIFSADMHEASARRLAIQTRLSGARARGDMSLAFQPLVDAKTARIIGAEALMRWKDAELGHVGPDEFIPVAESTGLIIEYGQWALNEACRQARKWREAIPNFHIAVNISPVQLIASDMSSTIKTALLKHDLPPAALEIEITEGVLIKDPLEAKSTLSELAEIGVSISIDDFGTGYSSLSYLHRFPFTTLKIDRMFVMDLPESSDSGSLVTAVLALAQRSDLKVIAEGVETQGQAQWLREQGCDILQGYLYGKPMSGEAFGALVENRDPNEMDGTQASGGGPKLTLV